MGMDHNVYVGPYLEIVHKTIREPDEDVFMCSNGACNSSDISVSSNVKFCSRCGFAIKAYPLEGDITKVYLHDIIVDEYGESLCYAGNLDVLICNRDIDGKLSHHDRHDEDNADERDPGKELTWFCKEYEDELNSIEASVDSMKIKWGVVGFTY